MSRSARYFHVAAWIWLLIAGILHQPSPAENSPDQAREGFHAAILVSRHIRPYMEALEGLQAGLDQSPDIISRDVFILDEYDLEHQKLLGQEILAGDPDLIISIGPEATSFAWDLSGQKQIPTVYSVVLNPESLTSAGSPSLNCGISLNIPPSIQLKDISRNLPGIRRLGVLFDPEFNAEYVESIRQLNNSENIHVVPLKVDSSKALPGVLEKGLSQVDALWLVPDETVISRTLVRYIIREAIYRDKPTIGYNRFFYESGAAMAFVLDFENIGLQTARIARTRLVRGSCPAMIPSYEVLINHRALESMKQEQGQ